MQKIKIKKEFSRIIVSYGSVGGGVFHTLGNSYFTVEDLKDKFEELFFWIDNPKLYSDLSFPIVCFDFQDCKRMLYMYLFVIHQLWQTYKIPDQIAMWTGNTSENFYYQHRSGIVYNAKFPSLLQR